MDWTEFMDLFRRYYPYTLTPYSEKYKEELGEDIESMLKEEALTPQEAADRFLDDILSNIDHIHRTWRYVMCGYPFLPEIVPLKERHESTIEYILRYLIEKGAVLSAEKILSPQNHGAFPLFDICADDDATANATAFDNYPLRGHLIDCFGLMNQIDGLFDIPWELIPANRGVYLYDIYCESKWDLPDNFEAQLNYFLQWFDNRFRHYSERLVIVEEISIEKLNKYIHYSALKGESHLLKHKFMKPHDRPFLSLILV